MNYSNYRFTLDMQSNISQVSLPVRLLDTSRRLYISLTDGGSPYTIANGCRAVFYARKADGHPIMNDCIIEKNTLIRYDLTQQTTTCAGVVDCEVRLYGADGNLITSPRFIMVVDERVVYDDDFPLSEAEQTILDNIILSETARVNAEVEREKTHEEMLASTQKATEITADIEHKLANGDFIGPKGDKGDKGDTGDSGVYVGTEEPTDPDCQVWLNPEGEEAMIIVGESAYEIAVRNGFEGTEEEWLSSLKGEQGETGAAGVGAEVVQTTGDREDAVMSQKAVSEDLNEINERIGLRHFVVNGTVKAVSPAYTKLVIASGLSLKAGKTYTLTAKATTNAADYIAYVHILKENDDYYDSIQCTDENNGVATKTFTPTADVDGLWVVMQTNQTSGLSVTATLEVTDTATLITQDIGSDETVAMSQQAITSAISETSPDFMVKVVKKTMVLGKQWQATVGSKTRQNDTIPARGCCGFVIKSSMPLEMIASGGYNFALVFVDDNDISTFDSGWKTSYIVPANQRFVFSVWGTNGVALTEETIKDVVILNPVLKDENEVSQSLYIEYGRCDGATYNFIRIPKVSNNGNTIKPVISLTSDDKSLNGAKCSALTYSKKHNLQFVINAGLFDVVNMIPVGQTIIDGVSITNTPMADDNGTPISDTECYPLCIDANGNLSTPYARSVDTATMIADGVKYAITGWGKLVDNFEIAQTDIDAEIVHKGKNYSRQCIGQFENGDYCVLTVWAGAYDTNYQNEAGMTYEECAQILVDHGVKFAYSLDGGGSAETVIKKRQINPLYNGVNGRSVPSVIYFTTD